jgi:transposase InsO family protein
MNDDMRNKIALFRYGVLSPLVGRKLRRGERKQTLEKLAEVVWTTPSGTERRYAAPTIGTWLDRYRQGGFEALKPRLRSDRGKVQALTPAQVELILDMRREDPGRTARLIQRELELAGLLRRGQVHVSTIQRLLRREGLSGPRTELDRPARYRWRAARSNELWQVDAVHGPALYCPSVGRMVRVKIFSLLDDRSRLITYSQAFFEETQQAFLTVLAGAVQRRGVPGSILADNHGSFRGQDAQIACAQLALRLVFARPYDGASKGKIERYHRTLRSQVLDRLDLEQVSTLEQLNARLAAWVEGEYNRRPHAGLGGRTPLEVWEEDGEEVRWLEDDGVLSQAFTASFERRARNDSTVRVHGKDYEVPTHLRREKVTVCYHLLSPERLWIDDQGTRVYLRLVDEVGNGERARPTPNGKQRKAAGPKTGLNAPEAFLRRMTRPGQGQGGAA